MNPFRIVHDHSLEPGSSVARAISIVAILVGFTSCSTPVDQRPAEAMRAEPERGTVAQVPSWSAADMQFFLHGSMSTEVVPERVLRAFVRTYPDLYPRSDLSHFGLIPDPTFGWPVGVSRRAVPHLGGLSSAGINCASCHTVELVPAGGGAPVRVLGVTSHFDAEAFFGAMIVATFKVADPATMKRFVESYLLAGDPPPGDGARQLLAREWQRQEQAIVAAIAADPFGAKSIAPGALYEIGPTDVRIDQATLQSGVDLAAFVRTTLRLFHNIRAALHVPDAPPDKAPPPSGPGRNDAFGLLSLALFGEPQPYAPVKYGVVWNLEHRQWVHWDGNTQSPIGRNLLASLGLGAPLIGKRGWLDFATVKRQTDLSERIRPARYPFAIDRSSASRGAMLYQGRCASCHDGPETDTRRLHAADEVGTEPLRAKAFTQAQADRFNTLLADLETPGYTRSDVPGIRGTQQYWAATLAGVWARAPYLHNGSVRTMHELLSPTSSRAKSFRRGSRVYDTTQMGYTDEGSYVLDTSAPGNGNMGHEYATDLSEADKRDLIEFLKTL